MFGKTDFEILQEEAQKWLKSLSLETLTAEQIKEIYFVAYHLYQSKRYAEAAPFFRILTMGQETKFPYWMGLGACQQMQREYESAFGTYRRAAWIFPDEPKAFLYVYMADCLFALKQIENALQLLKKAEEEAKRTGETSVMEHVAFMRLLWSNQNLNKNKS
jgi:secretion system chaperone SscA